MCVILVSMNAGSRQSQCMLRCCSSVLMRISGSRTGPSYSVLLVNQVTACHHDGSVAIYKQVFLQNRSLSCHPTVSIKALKSTDIWGYHPLDASAGSQRRGYHNPYDHSVTPGPILTCSTGWPLVCSLEDRHPFDSFFSRTAWVSRHQKG